MVIIPTKKILVIDGEFPESNKIGIVATNHGRMIVPSIILVPEDLGYETAEIEIDPMGQHVLSKIDLNFCKDILNVKPDDLELTYNEIDVRENLLHILTAIAFVRAISKMQIRVRQSPAGAQSLDYSIGFKKSPLRIYGVITSADAKYHKFFVAR